MTIINQDWLLDFNPDDYVIGLMKLFIKLLFTLLVICTTGLVTFAQPPATLVEVEPLQTIEFHDQITLVGRTEAKINSQIVSEVSGRVTAIEAAEGNPIERDQLLIRIDTARAALLLLGKAAQARQAEARAMLTRDYMKRIDELFSRDLVSETSRDSAKAFLIIADEQFAEQEAQRQQLALDLDNCGIKAPYTGHTLRRLVDVGEWVNPGTPVYEMVDLSTIIVTVDLPERYFGHLAQGTSVAISPSNMTGEPLTGIVTGIGRSASVATHTFPVLIEVDNSDGILGGGSLVQVTLSLNEKFSSFAVSKDAIIRNGLQTMVYSVTDGKAVPFPVVVSSTSGRLVAVSGNGLSEGMSIVVRGNERIYPGGGVRIAGEPAMQNSAPVASDGQTETEETQASDH